MNRYEERSLSEIYDIPVDEYIDTPVVSLPFSLRVINKLLNNGIISASQLFKLTPKQIMNIKSFGKKSFKEIEDFCRTLKPKRDNQNSLERTITSFKEFANKIAIGDFSFLDDHNWSADELLFAGLLQKSYNILGREMAYVCIHSPESALPIIDMLDDFLEKTIVQKEIQKLLWNIPSNRRNKKVNWYIKAFTLNDDDRAILLQFSNTDTTIKEFVYNIITKNEEELFMVKRFLNWCSFDLNNEILQLFKTLYESDRVRKIIQLRSSGHTLESIGISLGITRERVRQIEMKVRRAFSKLYSGIQIVPKIVAEHNGKTILSPIDISFFGHHFSEELLYLLENYEGSNYIYDKSLGVFIIDDDSLHNRLYAYLDSLPDNISMNRYRQLLLEAEERKIPKVVFEKAFVESYNKTGYVFHRHRLTLATICGDILRKYYPNGLHIYDTFSISEFRDRIKFEYGDIHLADDDRALRARIANVGILCGRGIYKAKNNQCITKELLLKIYKHIVDSDATVFFIGSLFDFFCDELYAEGVDNRYYLQGILHEAFHDEFVFRKDYISKDFNITSIYSSIINFIKKNRLPASKKRIQMEFPGITDVVISLAVSDSEVLNYFGEYFHASNLFITDSEKQYLFNVVCNITSDKQSHHIKDFYELITKERPEIFTRNGILYPFSSYSLLEYIFRDKFQFLRPYIAIKGVEIGRARERLKELIYCSDKISVEDIRAFAKDNRLQIQSMIEYINSYNDDFLLIDKNTLMRISEIGITENSFRIIDECVASAVTKIMPIFQLSIWSELPTLHVPWSDWLLYSILNKWSKRVSVCTSSIKMKVAVPLVFPRENSDIMDLSEMTISHDAEVVEPDNLDAIDQLLEDIIDDTDLGEC